MPGQPDKKMVPFEGAAYSPRLHNPTTSQEGEAFIPPTTDALTQPLPSISTRY